MLAATNSYNLVDNIDQVFPVKDPNQCSSRLSNSSSTTDTSSSDSSLDSTKMAEDINDNNTTTTPTTMTTANTNHNNSNLPILTSDKESWLGSSLCSVTQLTLDGLQLLMHTSQQMRSSVKAGTAGTVKNNKILGNVFFEASTRTACSFQAAMMRLGGNVIHVDGGGNTSAKKKGESLEDTIRCIGCYVDAIVLRHPTQGSIQQVFEDSLMTKPIINAGDGVGEHPTQALLDIFTIVDELDILSNTFSTITIVMLGDLKHGRTVHSLAKLLAQHSQLVCTTKLVLRYCSPEGLEMPQYIQDFVNAQNGGNNITIEQENYTDLSQAVQNANALYVTRIQKERFDSDEEYQKVKGSYVIDQDFLEQSAPTDKFVIMHPLPRVDEISTDIDKDPRSAYFRQMENGMYVRMAILSLILGL